MSEISFRNFRKMSISDRSTYLSGLMPQRADDLGHLGLDAEMASLSDSLIEHAIGYNPLPIGLAGEFLINGETLILPLCTEEPSVIAAASFAGSTLARFGGLSASASRSLIEGTIYIDADPGLGKQKTAKIIEDDLPRLQDLLAPVLANMQKRGGGLRSMTLAPTPSDDSLCLSFTLDVVDAMGANLVNTCAETLRGPIIEKTGAQIILAILSNEGRERMAEAHFKMPIKSLARAQFSGEAIAFRIVRANQIAKADPRRAVTHNKGIMNGISALALATGNDTRAIEASVHAYASSSGRYQALTDYHLEGEELVASLKIPLQFATVGGSVQYLPAARAALAILHNPNAQKLNEIAVSLGLAQNFAALWALTSEGIQKGHMKLHARRQDQ